MVQFGLSCLHVTKAYQTVAGIIVFGGDHQAYQ